MLLAQATPHQKCAVGHAGALLVLAAANSRRVGPGSGTCVRGQVDSEHHAGRVCNVLAPSSELGAD
jgi:hypothetical protein